MPRVKCRRCQTGEPHDVVHGTAAAYQFHGCRCGECKRWCSAHNAAYRAANKERIRLNQREYYEANRSRICARSRDHYYKNIDAYREYNGTYYRANRERLIAAERERQDRNSEYIRLVKRPRAREREKQRQDSTQQRSRRSAEPWSDAEDAIVMRSDMTQVEIAYILNRTLYAVKTRRDRLRNGHRAAYVRGRSVACTNGHPYREGSYKVDKQGRRRCCACSSLGASIKEERNRAKRLPAWLASNQDWAALKCLAVEWGMSARAASQYLVKQGCAVPDGRRAPETRAALGELRRTAARKRTSCNVGHRYTRKNTYIGPSRKRQCRICANSAASERRARQQKVAAA